MVLTLNKPTVMQPMGFGSNFVVPPACQTCLAEAKMSLETRIIQIAGH